MLTLSQKTKYALRALQFLARENGHGPILISTLAAKEQIPKKFLEAILLELKNQGILHSKKGKGGGYYLRKSPREISLGQVVRIFDGPIAPLWECHDEMTCGILSLMKEVGNAAAKILDGATIADVLDRVELLERDRRLGVGSYQI